MSTIKPINILLIEDNPGDVLLLKEALTESSVQRFRVTHAGRLDTGLDLLAEKGIDVIMLDLNLPDSQGLDTLKKLLARSIRAPIVVMTGLDDETLALEAVQQGAQDYLVKGSADGQAIARIVRYAIERHRLVQDLQISETRTRSIIESDTDGILIVDRQGEVRFVNPAAVALLGRPAEQLVGAAFGFPVGQPGELEIFRPGGSTCVVEMRASELIWEGQPATLTALQDITERKRAEEKIRLGLSELELLYASSLAVSRSLQPKEIGQKIIDILSEKLKWHHATIRLYHPESETLELLAFHQPGLENEAERLAAEERFRTMIAQPRQGFTGWVIKHGQPIYCGDVTKDRRYIVIWPEIRSGMYIPLKVSERMIGCLSVESERVNAFTETDEWLITTLATQAASALENARLFEETRQRLIESEAVNKISVALRTAESLETMLSALLDETLALLGTPAGAVWLHDADSEELHQAVSRGWFTQLPEALVKPGEGLVGTVFATGKSHYSREFSSAAPALEAAVGRFPAGWGGVCVPIHSAQAVAGVMLISVQLPRELKTGEIQVLNTLAEIVGIAIQRMRLHEQTEQQLQRSQALHEIDTVIAASFDLSFTLDTFLKNILAQLYVDAASILLLNRHTRTLDYTAGHGFRKPGIKQFHSSLSEGYAGRVALERRIIHSMDLPTDNTFPVYAQLIKNEGFVSYYGVPLITKGEVKGVMEIFHRSPLQPNAEWLDFLGALASQAAIAIDSSLTYNNLQRSNMELAMTYNLTLEGWSRALDMRDQETEGHSKRVTEMTAQLAYILAVSDVEMEHIRRGALLHDMGKIGIPDSILLKPGPLTEEEWAVMRTHPGRAYELLEPIPYLRSALEIPYCHHEKWDGSGYPRGLKGEQIPLAARIFAVVDVYDALTSNRPYRKAWPKAKVLEHLKTESGKHFDPQVLDEFLKMQDTD